jgi:predicted DNA-binding antitoxin AbrB/MazE fold protein
MTTAVKALYENGVFKPEEPVNLQDKAKVRLIIEAPTEPAREDGDDLTGSKAAREFIGMWKDAPQGEPIARDHDKYLYGSGE